LARFIASPAMESLATLADARPLCVDLDGTLVKSDTLHDSLLVLLRNRPASILRLPRYVFRGKAAFKAYVARNVELEAASLPYNVALLDYLREEHSRGRAIYLATGADEQLAHRVARHLGIFTDVLASDGSTNLTGQHKLERLRQRLDASTFDYIGNDTPDLPLLTNAMEPMIANPTFGLRTRIKAGGVQPVRSFEDRKAVFGSLVRTVRVHQWAKNLLVFVPLLCSHALSVNKLLSALIACACFSLTASSAYIVNDLLDLEADRRHPIKRRRPFAAGDLSAPAGISIAGMFLAAGLACARLLPGSFFLWLLIYLGLTLTYSWYFKRIALLDVMMLSGLYILRLLAGGAATQTPISQWLAGFSMFLFLSLAIAKRFAELENLRSNNAVPKNGRGYLITDLDQLRSFGTASAYAAVVVFAIYIGGSDVVKLYHRSHLLWLTVPLMILWLNRVWLLASRGELDEDPVAFALTDPISQVIGLFVLVVALLAL
jgi:4-hydroxybenzoate polyprenyltransferase/phosphoserine phosphatase